MVGMRLSTAGMVLLALLGLGAARAGAQEPDDDRRAAAKEHYAKGNTAYDLREYDRAIEEFKRAYELAPAPGLLYNIAQAYRLKGDAAEALSFYRQYLQKDPAAKNRADVEKRIAELEREIADEAARAERERLERERLERERAAAAGHEGAGPTGAGPGPAGPPGGGGPRPERRRSPLRLTGLITAVSGGLVLGGGVYFAQRARKSWDQVNAHADAGGTWGPEWDDRYARAETEELAGTILLIAGGAAVGTGVLLFVLGTRADRAAQVAAAPARGGGTVTVTWGF